MEARDQLASLYNAYRSGRLGLGDYQQIADWLASNVDKVLGEQGFDAFGVLGTRLYGILSDPTVRVLAATTELPRAVRVVVTRDLATADVMVSTILFKPPF